MQITACAFSKTHFTWDDLVDVNYTVKMGSGEAISASYSGEVYLRFLPNNQGIDSGLPRNNFLVGKTTKEYNKYLTIYANREQEISASGIILKKDQVMTQYETGAGSEFEGLTYEEAFKKHTGDDGAARAYPIGVYVTAFDSYGTSGRRYDSTLANAATFLLARIDPVINGVTLTDTHPANPYGKFGGYVAGQSKPKITGDVTLDPLDPTLTATHKIEIWKCKGKWDDMIYVEYLDEVIASAEADIATPLEPVLPAEVPVFLPDTEDGEGYDSQYFYKYVYTVTDSAGNTADVSDYIDIWNYYAPKFVLQEGKPAVQRYETKINEAGKEEYEASEIGNHVWVSLGVDVSPVGAAGRNNWNLLMEHGIAGETNGTTYITKVGDGADNSSKKTWTEDRSVLKPEDEGGTIQAAYRYFFTFTLTDALNNTAVLTVFVDQAGGVFGGNLYGLGIGMRARATEADSNRVDIAPGWRLMFHNEDGTIFEFPPKNPEDYNGMALVLVDGKLSWGAGGGGSSGGGIMPVSAMKSVAQQQYQNNTEVESVDLPGATSLGTYAFSGCSNLKTVNLPLVATVPASCFQNCASLETVDLGAATNIGYNALNGCSALKALIIRSDSVCSIASNTLTGSGIAKGTGYTYVPAVLVDSYKANSVWKTYAAQVRAKEDYPEITGG